MVVGVVAEVAEVVVGAAAAVAGPEEACTSIMEELSPESVAGAEVFAGWLGAGGLPCA
ncbi:MAG: hypothetical protein ACXWBM_00425 [Chthoniobacterales bacterium]